MRKMSGLIVCCIALLISGCGQERNSSVPSPLKEVENAKEKEQKLVEGRPIIASLQQTTAESVARDRLAEEIIANTDLQSGLSGKSTDDFAEELAIQGIEGRVAQETFEKVYGGYEGTDNAGVVFFEWKSGGAEQSGFWIGIKDPDERLDEMVRILQKKVDAGEILAENIYFYQCLRTQKEQNQLTSNVSSSLERIARSLEKPDAVSGAVSVDTITNVIEISHDFLTDKHKEILKNEYPDDEIQFEQMGRMVPFGNAPVITYPADETTSDPVKNGYYVMGVSEKGMLIVAATPENYGSTGGEEEFFAAIDVTYPEASTKLQVGQRIDVEYSGSIQTSYPGMGRAKFVEVLSDYKPDHATLTESEVIRKAIARAAEKGEGLLVIRDIQYDGEKKEWTLSMKRSEDVFEIVIADRR